MSKVDEAVGLGWEVWFLCLVLGAGGVMLLIVPLAISAGIDIALPNQLPSTPVDVDLPRAALGLTAAAAFALLAIELIRTGDWSSHDGEGALDEDSPGGRSRRLL